MMLLKSKIYRAGCVSVYDKFIMFPSCNWTWKTKAEPGIEIFNNDLNRVRIDVQNQFIKKGPIEKVIFHNINKNKRLIAILHDKVENKVEDTRQYSKTLEIYTIEFRKYGVCSEECLRLKYSSISVGKMRVERSGVIRYWQADEEQEKHGGYLIHE